MNENERVKLAERISRTETAIRTATSALQSLAKDPVLNAAAMRAKVQEKTELEAQLRELKLELLQSEIDNL